jgi:protein farnesyltransferase/geranylgeranyltransferase type-1 subunit alpha
LLVPTFPHVPSPSDDYSFVKECIALAPNNASAWNYLRGMLNQHKIPYATLQAFVEPYAVAQSVTETDLVDLDNPLPSKTAQLPCPAAIEFLADVYEREGGDNVQKAAQVFLSFLPYSLLPCSRTGQLWKSLADEHDTIRKK